MNRFRIHLLGSLLLLTLLTACKPTASLDSDPTPEEEAPTPQSSAPGFGASKSRPEGTPFQFPAGISLVKKPQFDGDCQSEAQEAKKIRGAGELVSFCLSFSNANNYPVRVELPPGLIWVAEKSEVYEGVSQNGVIMKTVTLLVPAHAVETIWLNAFCINFDRSSTRSRDTFEAQPILTNHAGLLDLARQLSTKKINEDEYTNGPTGAEREQLDFVQVAVVDVQVYGKVQASTQPELDKLPNSK